tara:strand:- start:1471 stop:1749 length:279 start_codon:yes stop_codon:yes gene_type:complete
LLVKELALEPDDVESRSMGAGGEDLMLSSQARKVFPYSVECKNQESLNVWKAYEQSQSNSGSYEPLLVIKKNRKDPLIVVDAKYFIELTKRT